MSAMNRMMATIIMQTPSSSLSSQAVKAKHALVGALIAASAISSPVQASDLSLGSILGGIIGAGAGSRIGNGTGSAAAAVILGSAGAAIGEDLQRGGSEAGDTTLSKVIRRGGGAAVGAGIGSRFGGGSGRNIMTIAGGVAGAFLADAIFSPKPHPGDVAPDVMRSGGTGTVPAQFRNGTKPLAQDEKMEIDKAFESAWSTRDELAENRRELFLTQKRLDFSSGEDFRRARFDVDGLRSRDNRLAETLYDKIERINTIMYTAATKYDLDVSSYQDDLASLSATPTRKSASYEDIMASGGYDLKAPKRNSF